MRSARSANPGSILTLLRRRRSSVAPAAAGQPTRAPTESAQVQASLTRRVPPLLASTAGATTAGEAPPAAPAGNVCSRHRRRLAPIQRRLLAPARTAERCGLLVLHRQRLLHRHARQRAGRERDAVRGRRLSRRRVRLRERRRESGRPVLPGGSGHDLRRQLLRAGVLRPRDRVRSGLWLPVGRRAVRRRQQLLSAAALRSESKLLCDVPGRLPAVLLGAYGVLPRQRQRRRHRL